MKIVIFGKVFPIYVHLFEGKDNYYIWNKDRLWWRKISILKSWCLILVDKTHCAIDLLINNSLKLTNCFMDFDKIGNILMMHKHFCIF